MVHQFCRFAGRAVLASSLFVLGSCGGSTGGGGSAADRKAIATLVDTVPTPAEITLQSLGASVDATVTAGASVGVTAADGTGYSLVIPADALPYDTSVTLTLAQGSTLAGVAIEPDGLYLKGLATLTVTPAAGATLGASLWWDGSGVVAPALAAPTADGKQVFLLSHFSGYGNATTPAGAPALTPVDQLRESTVGFTGEAMLAGELSDVDRQILDDGANAVWKDYLLPLLKKGSKECTAGQVFNEALRFLAMAQLFGLAIESEASQTISKYAETAYSSMKKCAKDRCEAGDLNAGSMMIKALTFGQLFDVEEANSEAATILAQVYSGDLTAPWAKCRILSLQVSMDSELTGQLIGATATTVTSKSTALGILRPGPDGHTGEIGMWMTGTGYGDGTELTGFLTALVYQKPMDYGVDCSVTPFPPGYVSAKVTLNVDAPPSIEIVPMVSSTKVTCGEIPPVDALFHAYMPAGLVMAMSGGIGVDRLTHQFTTGEAWPTATGSDGKVAALGYRWRETLDAKPLMDQYLPIYRQIESHVSVRLGLGTETSPSLPSPGPAGLTNGILLE